MKPTIAFIGSLKNGTDTVHHSTTVNLVQTEHGEVEITKHHNRGVEYYSLPRGRNNLAAHAVNHRANIAALKKIGVSRIVGSAMVGCLRANLGSHELIAADQFLEFSKRAAMDYFDDDVFRDFDFTNPLNNVGASIANQPVIAAQLLDARDRHLGAISQIVSRTVLNLCGSVVEPA